LLDWRTSHLACAARFDFSGEVVAHQEQINSWRFGRMHGNFGRWHLKDQPAVASIDRSQAKNLRKKSTVTVGVFAVEDDGSEDHGHILSDLHTRLSPTACARSMARSPLRAPMAEAGGALIHLPVRRPRVYEAVPRG